MCTFILKRNLEVLFDVSFYFESNPTKGEVMIYRLSFYFWKVTWEKERLWFVTWAFILKSNLREGEVMICDLLFWKVIWEKERYVSFYLKKLSEKKSVCVTWAFILKSNQRKEEVSYKFLYEFMWAFILKSKQKKWEILKWDVSFYFEKLFETRRGCLCELLFGNVRARGAWLKVIRRAPSWRWSLRAAAVPVWLPVWSRAVGSYKHEQDYGARRALNHSSSKLNPVLTRCRGGSRAAPVLTSRVLCGIRVPVFIYDPGTAAAS